MGTEKFLFRLEQPHGTGNVYISWQKNLSNYLATTGIDGMVNIINRYGQIQERIKLPGLCTGFEWNSDGDLLGIISQSSQLILWDSSLFKKYTVDLKLKDTMTCLFWTRNEQTLAVGSAKGNVCLYDYATTKRTPVIGKHSKKITCGGWNSENILVLGSEDKTLSLSNIEGDTLKIIQLRAEPSEIQFSEMKVDERIGGENTISLIIGKKNLYLYNLFDPENPIELAFQQHYGSLVTYKWFGDGYILLGFSLGYFIAISSHIKEVGQELFQIKNHKNSLNDIALCVKSGKAASCGDNIVKIHDITNLQETSSVLTLPHETGLERIAWSEDGQLLAVCTVNGSVNVYVSDIPLLTTVCGNRILVLSNLSEVNLYNYTGSKVKLIPNTIPLETEPTFLGIGPYHLIAGTDNKAWFYDLTKPQPNLDHIPLLIKNRQYDSKIESVKANSEFISVLLDGKLELHTIEESNANNTNSESRESIVFPTSNLEAKITCHALTPDFLIYGTDKGQIVYFCLENWDISYTYNHSSGLTEIFSDLAGTKVIFTDIKNHVYLYSAVNGEIITIPNLPLKILGVVWDSCMTDKNLFIIFDENEMYPYIFQKFSINGPVVQKIDEKVSIPANHVPLFMFSGEIILARPSGLVTSLFLDTSFEQNNAKQLENKDLEETINRHIAYHRFSTALKISYLLGSKKNWMNLATKALKNLEVDIAVHAYKELKDVAMVSSLEQILNTEDVKLLAGYCCMFVKDYNNAQKWFLSSQNPHEALNMQRGLLQWDRALELAQKVAPDQVSFISREYAQQLEFIGNYTEAYVFYEKGLYRIDSGFLSAEHIYLCKCGIARTSIRCGNYKQGLAIATELNDKTLYVECADICASKKQFLDAAALYEKAEMYDKAASAYIKVKNWKKVEELLHFVTSNKVHVQYAEAKEVEGKYEAAAKAYYLANDFDSVIRLQLDYLNDPTGAVELAQKVKSLEGFKMIARFFQRSNDFSSAIKFLILSNSYEEAREIAGKQRLLAFYGETLLNIVPLENIRVEDFSSLASHFEKERDYLLAGKYYFYSKDYVKALDYLLKASKINENEAISLAIDTVTVANDKQLASRLVEFLLGEMDGVPRDPKHLFRLYMARKQYKEAAKSALIIANEEQINGNYKNARDILFNTYRDLKTNDVNVPHEMYHNLMLLHSYILVRLHVKRGDHLTSAKLLIRVAENISKFPSHIVPILTSTVIECHRADLKQAAHKYAAILVQNPNYRKEIDQKYVKKIESIVRKAPKNGTRSDFMNDPIEPATPCPFCGVLFSETSVVCSGCKSNVPFCIVTGYHVIKDDTTICYECQFPAIRSKFLELLDTEEKVCPMCQTKLDPGKLPIISEYQNLI